MTADYFEIRERLRDRYVPKVEAKAEVLGDQGFLTEVAGRVILTARADTLTEAGDLPPELAERWEKAATGNPYMMWLQGRFVEAEKANRNGAFWSTDDLQFGEMSVRHGPLNWLHEDKTVIGTIADNALIHPAASTTLPNVASMNVPGWHRDEARLGYQTGNGFITDEQIVHQSSQFASLFEQPAARPYMAAVSAIWKWVHPDKVQAIESAADQNRLYYSMECVAREMSCQSDETREGCGKSYDYVTAMLSPEKCCEHIQARSSARRMVDPSFLGGAVIVPPTQPGWGDARVEVMRQAARLAEQTEAAAGDMSDTEWEQLMAGVLQFARG